MSCTDSGKKHTQKVVDLRDRADRTAGIVSRGLLADRNRGAEPADQIDIRLRHLAHELTGIVAQTLDVSPLTFGVKSVEGERRFSASRDSGKTDQFSARKGQADIAEVVLASTFDPDFRSRHSLSGSFPRGETH